MINHHTIDLINAYLPVIKVAFCIIKYLVKKYKKQRTNI